jgi:hypothetical protein
MMIGAVLPEADMLVYDETKLDPAIQMHIDEVKP